MLGSGVLLEIVFKRVKSAPPAWIATAWRSGRDSLSKLSTERRANRPAASVTRARYAAVRAFALPLPVRGRGNWRAFSSHPDPSPEGVSDILSVGPRSPLAVAPRLHDALQRCPSVEPASTACGCLDVGRCCRSKRAPRRAGLSLVDRKQLGAVCCAHPKSVVGGVCFGHGLHADLRQRHPIVAGS